MIEQLINNPHLLHQAGSDDVPEMPIAGFIDNGGSIILSQEGRYICVDPGSVKELKKLIDILAQERAARAK